MSEFLSVYYQNKPGKRVPEGANQEWLEAELDKAIENDIDWFLLIAKDPDYDYKLFIHKALKKRAILKEDNKYYLPEGDIIANSNADLVLWLKDPINDETYMQIKARVEV